MRSIFRAYSPAAVLVLLLLGVFSCKQKDSARAPGPYFDDPQALETVLDSLKQIQKDWGTAERQKGYNSRPLGKTGTVVMQYSSRRRLYDHNIFLRGLYSGCLVHSDAGRLNEVFARAAFIDLGSAILYDQGAPTVRDIFEDAVLHSALAMIVATDINDARSASTRFIDLYRAKGSPLPFPVKEIPMTMNEAGQFVQLLQIENLAPQQPLILRASHSGPDLFYDRETQKQHLQALAQATYQRPVLYLFERYLFFKPANSATWSWIANFAPDGYAFTGVPWTRIDWGKRRLTDAIKPRGKALQFAECGVR